MTHIILSEKMIKVRYFKLSFLISSVINIYTLFFMYLVDIDFMCQKINVWTGDSILNNYFKRIKRNKDCCNFLNRLFTWKIESINCE